MSKRTLESIAKDIVEDADSFGGVARIRGGLIAELRTALADREQWLSNVDVPRRERATPPTVDLYAMPLTEQCDETHRSDLGSHHCTMTKGHGGPVHVEVDPVFGNPRWVWPSLSSGDPQEKP